MYFTPPFPQLDISLSQRKILDTVCMEGHLVSSFSIDSFAHAKQLIFFFKGSICIDQGFRTLRTCILHV